MPEGQPPREILLGKLLLLLAEAAPEELTAILRFLTGQALLPPHQGSARPRSKRALEKGPLPPVEQTSPAYVFRRAGKLWEVIFGGAKPFYLEDTLGARYLDYLLHHPNEPIPAFDLEVAVMPEKGEARSRTSIQPESDGRALREYAQALRRLQAERDAAQSANKQEEVARLEEEMEALELMLKGEGGESDTGKRARDNVRKAIRVVLEQLAHGQPRERKLAEHLDTHLSIGLECLYSLPQGRVWD